MSEIGAVERAVAIFCGESAGLTGVDLGRPTPCVGWDVRALVGHVAGVYDAVANALHGERVDLASASVELGDDPGPAIANAASEMMQAWREPDALDRVLRTTIRDMPAALATRIVAGDSLLHAWDLARALGRNVTLPEDLTAAQLAMMQQYYDPATRGPGRGFDVAVEWADDAPVQERLVALSGRDPTWSPVSRQ
jgi:uncharacterized protein (TIGR03086 family)